MKGSLEGSVARPRTPISASRWSIAAAAAIPIICFAVYVAMTVVADTRTQLGQKYTAVADALLSAVDTRLESDLGTLQGLATSSFLQGGDLAAFHEQVRRFAAARGDWRAITLVDTGRGGGRYSTARSPMGENSVPCSKGSRFWRR